MTIEDYEHKLFMQQVKWQHAVMSADWDLIDKIEKENRETRKEFEEMKKKLIEKKKALRQKSESFEEIGTI